MNTDLRYAIVDHVLANLRVVQSAFVDQDKTRSLMSKEFLLPEQVYSYVDQEKIAHKVWGCQLTVGNQNMIMLLTNFSLPSEFPEYAMFIQLGSGPCYGLYLRQDSNYPEAFMAFSLDGKSWLECRTGIQAAFLAGMEQVKDIGPAQEKCVNYKTQFDAFLSFIKFNEDTYEG